MVTPWVLSDLKTILFASASHREDGMVLRSPRNNYFDHALKNIETPPRQQIIILLYTMYKT